MCVSSADSICGMCLYVSRSAPFAPLTPPKGLKGFIPVGPRPTESVLDDVVHANKELFVNFEEKSRKGGTKAKMEIWVVNLGEAFNVRRRLRKLSFSFKTVTVSEQMCLQALIPGTNPFALVPAGN